MQKITPCLWFDHQAEDAVNFYLSVFKDAEIKTLLRYGPEGPGTPGTVLTITFTLAGQEFMALNGGPHFTFSPAVSFIVNCETQQEVDHLWEQLSADENEEQCGWLKDKFGLSWQIVPTILDQMMLDEDPEKVSRVTRAMLQMKKLDIAALKRAFEGI